MKIFHPGRRKLTIGLLAFTALCLYGVAAKAEFVAFGDRILLWLSAMLAAHVTQQATAKPQPQPPVAP
jgi:hypothetical protein